MKMKKIAFVFSMITMFCVLTACSNGKEELDFDYADEQIISSTLFGVEELKDATDSQIAYWENSENELASVYLSGVQNLQNAETECGDFLGFRSKTDDLLTIDYDEIGQMEEDEFYTWYANIISSVEASITEDGDNVTVELIAAYEKRDVVISYVYEKNPEYAYAYDLYQQQVEPYQVKEIVASPDYTTGEKMQKAASNTLMGMGTVFAVLIFISLIIGQFERLNTLIVKSGELIAKLGSAFKRRKSKEQSDDRMDEAGSSATTGSTVTIAASSGNPMEDSQLVAVITAAVVASNVASGGTDRLVVRSIRKAKR